jgi:sec-independent protein translocase protein TatA
MFANLSGWHLVILLAVVVLLFGSTKLPALARSLGQSMRILRTEVAFRDEEPNASDKKEE